jgi:UDP-N-acetylmuramoylalanine--D-glutamate ligase
MEKYRGKKVLIVGLGKTGFALINFFNTLGCEIRVTDIKPIFDLNKEVKRVKRMSPAPELTLGEHRDEDFLEADVIVYSHAIDPHLPQLTLAREHGKNVYSEIDFSCRYCPKPIIAICGSYGRTTISHMVGYALRVDKKNVFIGGTSDEPMINFHLLPNKEEIDYVIVELSPYHIQTLNHFKPAVAVYPNIEERKIPQRFKSIGEYLDVVLKVAKNLSPESYLVANFDRLANQAVFRDSAAQTFWYSRKSFVQLGVIGEIQGTHFHDKRIHSSIHSHSEFVVSKMRVIGQNNRENLLALVTVCKALRISDNAIQSSIEKFPGIPNRLEYVIEKNGVKFYNDSKTETMKDLKESLDAFKEPVILIAGGKDTEQEYEGYKDIIKEKVRILVLVGECKENMNRELGDSTQTFLVGSFDESILLAYQKSRTGDTIVLSPGNDGSDVFRDYVEKGNYYKKLIFQL